MSAPTEKCLICRYDLTGLPDDAMCPECGAPVEGSRSGRMLRYSDSDHLRKLVRGFRLLVVVASIYAVFQVIDIVARECIPMDGSNASLIGRTTLSAIALTVLALFLVGWWFTTDLDETWGAHGRLAFLRWTVRVAGGATIVLTAARISGMMWVDAMLAVDITRVPRTPWMFWYIFTWLAVLGEMSWFVAAVLYVRRLARRCADPFAERRALTLAWAGPMAWVALFAARIGLMRVFSRSPEVLLRLVPLQSVVLMGLYVWFYVRLLARILADVTQARQEATERSASAADPTADSEA